MAVWNTFEQVRERINRNFKLFRGTDGLDETALGRGYAEVVRRSAKLSPMRRRTELLVYLLDHVPVGVDPDDWFGARFFRRAYIRDDLSKCKPLWMKTLPERSEISRRASFPDLDLTHTAPDWFAVLKLGFPGLRDRALRQLEKHPREDVEGVEFLQSVAECFDAICRCVGRMAAEAERTGAERSRDALKTIAEGAPKTFQEALQLALLFRAFQEYSGIFIRSEGIFQRQFITFYRNDLACGRLTREQAKELLKFYFENLSMQEHNANHNICIGGASADGTDANNELSELVLEVFAERDGIDPKLSLRVGPHTPENLLDMAAGCIKKGQNSIVFANDSIAFPAFLKAGKKPEDLIDFVPIGCYEPAILGREMCCSMSAYYNFAGIFESLFESDFQPYSMEDVVREYLRLQHIAIGETLAGTCVAERFWKEVNPSPVLSGTMISCVEKGRDVSDGGSLYNSSGVTCIGIGTAADALAAVEYAVFRQNLCSWRELGKILTENWTGNETLRAELCAHAPKYGRNDDCADRYAVQIAKEAARQINSTPNTRGGFFQMGNWSIDHSVLWGTKNAATPDGCFAGEPLSKNLCATIGMDTRGITAMMHSAMKFDHTDYPDGSVLDVMLHPSAVRGEGGEKLIVELLRTWFSGGGFFIHFNIVDAETLKKARREPEKFRNLQIRVCGWNARFVDLSEAMQECFIREAESKGA